MSGNLRLLKLTVGKGVGDIVGDDDGLVLGLAVGVSFVQGVSSSPF